VQTVSLEQLAHKIPPTAAREYRESSKALAKGDLDHSIVHCRKAVEADPDNASAHNDLGVLYLDNNQPELARAEFQHAIVLQPALAKAHANLSFALLTLGRPAEAEASARLALEHSANDRRANLLLGWSMAAQFHYSKEALASLRCAAREYSEAHLAAADVLIHQGALPEAKQEIEAYLASGSPDQKSLAEAWLRLLTIQ
jgi:Flp pilus assembly protein TadD